MSHFSWYVPSVQKSAATNYSLTTDNNEYQPRTWKPKSSGSSSCLSKDPVCSNSTPTFTSSLSQLHSTPISPDSSSRAHATLLLTIKTNHSQVSLPYPPTKTMVTIPSQQQQQQSAFSSPTVPSPNSIVSAESIARKRLEHTSTPTSSLKNITVTPSDALIKEASPWYFELETIDIVKQLAMHGIHLAKKVATQKSRQSIRTPNCFILYRSQKAKEIAAAHPHLNQSEISRMVASSWKKEPQCVIDKYRRLHYEKKDIINAIVKERGKGADFSDLHYQKGKKKRSRDRATTSSDEDSSVSDFGSGMSLESPPISYLPPQDRSGSPSSSSTTSANCRSGVKKRRVTKPTNTFIEYRKYIMARLDDANLDYNQVELSRITSTLWKSEPPEIKNRFKDNYQKTKLEYAAKSSQKKRRGQRTTALLTPLTSTENKSFPFDFKSPPDNLTNAASRKYDGVNSNKCSRLPPICNPQSNISANTTHHSSPVSTSSSSYSMYGGSVANTTFSPFTQHQNKAISTQGLLDIGRRLSVPTMPATHMGLTVPQYQSTSPHSNAYKDRRSSSSSSILELPKIQISNHHSNQNITPMTKLTLSGDKISPQIHNQGINVSGYYEIGITTNGSNAGPRLPSISSLVSTRATINNTRLSIEETKQPLLVCNEYSRPSHAETNCCKRTTKNIKMGSIDFLLCFPTFHKTSNNINTRESSSPQHMQLSEQVNRQQDKMPKFLSSPPMDIESPSMLSTPTFRTPDTLSISNSRANSIQL